MTTPLDPLGEQLKAELSPTYELRREIGGGGMSRVFLAEEKSLGRLVVIKVLSPGLAADISAERFVREMRLASQLQQANIVPVFATGVAAGLPYYSMPYVDGLSLRTRLGETKDPLAVDESATILKDIARALAFAHERGIVHRDVKPENILLSGGAAVVTDFGIAKAVSDSTTSPGRATLTEVGTAIGTPAYMSPEQASGDEVTASSDIYSWGLIAYEMLAGKHPFAERTTGAALIRAQIAETPKPISALRPEVPKPLADVVMRTLTKDPSARPQNGRELLGLIGGGGTTTGERASVLKQRKPVIVLLGAAVIVVAIAVGATEYFRRHAPTAEASDTTIVAASETSSATRAPKSVAVLPFVNVGGNPQQEYFSDGMTDEIADALARIPGLRLASRTSSFAFKGQPATDVRTIGKKLNVSSLLEGQVARAGDRLRVSAQLTDAGNGLVLWRESYERDLKDVFAVQDEIARAIASALQVALSDSTRVVSGTTNAKAHDLYLHGLFAQANYSEGSIRQSVALFDSAIALDPKYGDAYAGLADSWVNLADDWLAPSEAMPKAAQAARKAIELDPSNGRAHAALLFSDLYNPDEPSLLREVQTATRLSPNDATTAAIASITLQNHDLPLALQLAKHAYDLDQADPLVALAYSYQLMLSGMSDSAVKITSLALAKDPTAVLPRYLRGQALNALGKYKEALADFVIVEPALTSGAKAGESRAYALMGDRTRALAITRELEAESKRHYVSKDYIAQGFAALGMNDSAFKWLDGALADKSAYARLLWVDPAWKPLRGDSRMAELGKKYGLKEQPRAGR